ncbi:hypothetical protein GCM10010214_11010 [Streptomyces abikoensis]|nr:hypothetical protein GCM10010214_11010 [Streptomyces abikoensis]
MVMSATTVPMRAKRPRAKRMSRSATNKGFLPEPDRDASRLPPRDRSAIGPRDGPRTVRPMHPKINRTVDGSRFRSSRRGPVRSVG